MNKNKPSLEETLAYVTEKFAGITDHGGHPYIGHLVRVRNYLKELFPDCIEDDEHIALLHDVIEDTDDTDETLRAMGYSEYVIQGVLLVTRDPEDGLTYQQKIQKIADSGHLGAIRVKYADNTDNSNEDRNAELEPEHAAFFRKRYGRSKETLKIALFKFGKYDNLP